jgi:hypothetical protein
MDVKDSNSHAARLPGDPEQWPTDWRYRFQEREAIMLESNVPDARQKAIADIQRCAETESGGSVAEKLERLDDRLKAGLRLKP